MTITLHHLRTYDIYALRQILKTVDHGVFTARDVPQIPSRHLRSMAERGALIRVRGYEKHTQYQPVQYCIPNTITTEALACA